jgi:aminoglycoside phosphotransferase (APT) family kinase protein
MPDRGDDRNPNRNGNGIQLRPNPVPGLRLKRPMDNTRHLLNPPDSLWTRWHRWLDDDSIWPTHLSMVHGDLHPGHLLLNDYGTLCGILDWTEAHAGDPGTDFAMFHGCFGEKILRTLTERFHIAGGITWPSLAQHAIERWTAFPAMVAQWALDNDNLAVIDHARNQIAKLTVDTPTV